MKNIKIFVLITLFSVIAGCSFILRGTLDDYVNEKWPPIDYRKVKEVAVASSQDELKKVVDPALLLNVPTEALKEGFASALLDYRSDDVKVISSNIQPEEQGIKFTTTIEGTINNPQGKFQAKVEGWGVVSLSNHTATIHPVLKSARLTKVKIKKWGWAAKPVSAAINDVISRYINNINGAIKPMEYRIDPKSIGLNAQPQSVEVSPGKWITVPGVGLGPAAALIDKDGLHLLAQLEVITGESLTQASITTATYEEYKKNFWDAAAPVRSGPDRNQAGLFLSTTFITKLLAPVFNPIALEELQQTALQNTLESLKTEGLVASGVKIKGNVLVERFTEIIKKALNDSEVIGYGEPQVSLSEQTVVVKMPVEGRFDDSKIGFKGVVTAAGIIANSGGELYYRLVLISIELKEVEHLGGIVGLTPFVSSVNELLSQLVPYLNGALDNEPIQINIPKLKPIPIVQSKVQINPAELSPIEPGAILAIPRLTESGLDVLIVVAPDVSKDTESLFDVDLLSAQQTAFNLRPGTEEKIAASQNSVSPAEVDSAFIARWQSGLPAISLNEEKTLAAALSINWAMSYVNKTLYINRVEITAPINSEKSSFDSGHLRVADWLQPECKPGLECSRKSCDRGECKRPSGKCKWDCTKCINLVLKKVCADDPFCLANRAACNLKEEGDVAACNIAEEAKKSACNVAEEAKLGACKAAREIEVLGCNIVNETIRAIRQIDSIGRFTGDVQAHGVAQIANPEIKYDAQNSKLMLSVDAKVNVHIDGKLAFTPADIGHILVCPIKGSVNFSADGSFLRGRTNLTASLIGGQANPDGSLPLEMRIDQVAVSGQLSPAPVDALLGQNPHLYILCNPIVTQLGSIGTLGKISAYSPTDILKAIERAIPNDQDDIYRGLIAFTTGIVNETVDIPSMRVDIPKMDIQFADQQFILIPEWDGGSLIYTQ